MSSNLKEYIACGRSVCLFVDRASRIINLDITFEIFW